MFFTCLVSTALLSQSVDSSQKDSMFSLMQKVYTYMPQTMNISPLSHAGMVYTVLTTQLQIQQLMAFIIKRNKVLLYDAHIQNGHVSYNYIKKALDSDHKYHGLQIDPLKMEEPPCKACIKSRSDLKGTHLQPSCKLWRHPTYGYLGTIPGICSWQSPVYLYHT